MSKLAINKAWDLQGYAAAMESAFSDYVLMMQNTRQEPGSERRLPGVDLALRHDRGQRAE